MGKSFSKDPITTIISIREFYRKCDYLNKAVEHLFENKMPQEDETYFKFTSDKLICIVYTRKLTNFGEDSKEKLDKIYVAYRNGTIEFQILEDRLLELRSQLLNIKNDTNLELEIEKLEKNIEWAKKNFPVYAKHVPNVKPSNFKDFLINIGKKFDIGDDWVKKPIIIDTETNGIRKSYDDLLSLSIYDPNTGMCYNRYFPLDFQPLVLTTFIHGITDDALKNQTHWTQEEVDEIIEYFDLNNAIVFSYSGGKGTFDYGFIKNYCKRHNLIGFENLDYQNIKSYIPKAPLGSHGQLTKDNLCRIFKIEGVSDIHSSLNDCILEWQLLDKLIHKNVFFIQEHLFAYHPEYIIPVSYLSHLEELVRYAKLDLKPLVGTPTKIFRFSFPKRILRKIKKFPTNITGIAIENCINHLLNAEKQDNIAFLKKNKSHLEYIGSLDTNLIKIPIIAEDDGTIKTDSPEFKEYVNEVNIVTKVIEDNLGKLISFIQKKIFNQGHILSQELIISNDKKVLALCDLSNNTSVLEIKTMNVIGRDGLVKPNITKQLYFQRKNRKTYLLSLDFQMHSSFFTGDQVLNSLIATIYEVNIEEKELGPTICKMHYGSSVLEVFSLINKNNKITQNKISKITGRSPATIGKTIRLLQKNGIIERTGSKRKAVWKVLKQIRIGDTYDIELPPNL